MARKIKTRTVSVKPIKSPSTSLIDSLMFAPIPNCGSAIGTFFPANGLDYYEHNVKVTEASPTHVQLTTPGGIVEYYEATNRAGVISRLTELFAQ